MLMENDTALEIVQYFVTPSWVAKFYNVSTLRVYRAIRDGKIRALRVRGGTLVIDSRLLPTEFPR